MPPKRKLKAKSGARKKRSSNVHFSTYVFRVLKQVHPELAITSKAMKIMDDFMKDIFNRLAEEAASLVKVSRKSTLSSQDFQTATRLILPGELAQHAVNEGTKAVANFMGSKFNDRDHMRRYHDVNNEPLNRQPMRSTSVDSDVAEASTEDEGQPANVRGSNLTRNQCDENNNRIEIEDERITGVLNQEVVLQGAKSNVDPLPENSDEETRELNGCKRKVGNEENDEETDLNNSKKKRNSDDENVHQSQPTADDTDISNSPPNGNQTTITSADATMIQESSGSTVENAGKSRMSPARLNDIAVDSGSPNVIGQAVVNHDPLGVDDSAVAELFRNPLEMQEAPVFEQTDNTANEDEDSKTATQEEISLRDFRRDGVAAVYTLLNIDDKTKPNLTVESDLGISSEGPSADESSLMETSRSDAGNNLLTASDSGIAAPMSYATQVTATLIPSPLMMQWVESESDGSNN